MDEETMIVGRLVSEIVARSRDGYLLVRTYRTRPAGQRWSAIAFTDRGREIHTTRSTLAEALSALNDQIRQSPVPADS